MQMHSGQEQKASTVLYLERRNYSIIKYSSLSFLKKCSYCSYPVLNFWSGLPLSKAVQWNLSQILVENVGMSTFCELSPPVLFSGEGIGKGHFWVQKMHLPRGSLAQGNVRVTLWTVSSLCIFWIPLGLMEDFHRNLNLSLTSGPVSCVRCPQLFIYFLLNLIGKESSTCAVQHLPVAGRKDRSQPLNL